MFTLDRLRSRLQSGADPANKFSGGNFSNIWQPISVRVHYCKRDEAYFTIRQWQNNGRQHGPISPMLFSEFHKTMVKKVFS